MSNLTLNQVDEKLATSEYNGDWAAEPQINGSYQTPIPVRSRGAEGSYSDVASTDSQHSTSKRRRYQRGGRKQNVEDGPISNDANGVKEDHDAYQKGRSARPSNLAKKPSPHSIPKADSGIRAFNMRRARSSGGGRPFSMTVDRPESRSMRRKENKKKPKKEKADSEWEDNEGEESEGEDRDKKKPFSIRLDLNLELEIFLRAKIKGDVTITFLE